MNKKIAFIFFAVVLICFAVFVAIIYWTGGMEPPVVSGKIFRVGDNNFQVEIAETMSAMEKGLGDRDSLAKDHGMLFIFPVSGTYPFWMKGMYFPIDIVWIRGDRVVGTTENMQAEPGVADEALKLYYPPEAIDKVLEVSAGAVAHDGIQAGDSAALVDR